MIIIIMKLLNKSIMTMMKCKLERQLKLEDNRIPAVPVINTGEGVLHVRVEPEPKVTFYSEDEHHLIAFPSSCELKLLWPTILESFTLNQLTTAQSLTKTIAIQVILLTNSNTWLKSLKNSLYFSISYKVYMCLCVCVFVP